MKNKLFKNIGFLTLSQIANYIIPLLVIPYITRVVGVENYGMIEFATVSMIYFIVVVNYGFTATATRKIAQASTNNEKISYIFSSVMGTKLFLFFISFILFLVALFFIPKFWEYKQLMLYAFPVVFGWTLFPDFLFQGLQKLQVLALANFVVKLMAAVLIIVFLKTEEDFYLVVGINSLAQISVGLFTLFYAFKSLKFLKFKFPNWKSIKATLGMSRFVFASQFFQRVYGFSSILILGFLLTETELGIFTASMKLIVVSVSFLFMPLSGALFPYLSKLYKEDLVKFKIHFRKMLLIMLALSIFSAAVLMVMSEFLINLIFGPDFIESVPYVKIMAPILVFSAMAHFGLNQGLLVLKKDTWFLAIYITSAVLLVGLNLIIVPNLRLEGAVWIKLFVEAFIGILSLGVFYKMLRKE